MSERRLYVGYLPAPRKHALAAKVAFAAVLFVAAGIGFVVAKTMNDPGDAVWDTSTTHRITGTLHIEPVVFLETKDGPVLLVEAGKFGALPRASELAGRAVEATGFLLTREGHRMLELAPGPAGLSALGEPGTLNSHAPAGSREFVAEGEILDAKCYLGAMKPGQGRSHKACAVLCLRGGIPALFVGVDKNGTEFRGVLAPGEDGVLEDRWLALVGEPVTLRGTSVETNGLATIEVLEAARRRQ